MSISESFSGHESDTSLVRSAHRPTSDMKWTCIVRHFTLTWVSKCRPPETACFAQLETPELLSRHTDRHWKAPSRRSRAKTGADHQQVTADAPVYIESLLRSR
jgi:hypothetical protein